MKKCSKCGEDKPATTEFFRARNPGKYVNHEGLHNQCKICESKQRKKHYKENRERLIKNAKEWNESNKERVKENQKEYRKNNREKLNIKQKEWANSEENKCRIKEYHKGYSNKWRKENKEKISEYLKNNKDKINDYSRIGTQRRNALKRNLPATLTVNEWEQIKQKFNNTCCYCGENTTLEQEHFIPVTKGGWYTKENIIPACKSCNCSKGNKDFFDWYPEKEFYSQDREVFIIDHITKQREK